MLVGSSAFNSILHSLFVKFYKPLKSSFVNFNQNPCIPWRIHHYKYPKSQDFFGGDAIFLSSKLIQNGTTLLDHSYYSNVTYPFPFSRFLTLPETLNPRSQAGAGAGAGAGASIIDGSVQAKVLVSALLSGSTQDLLILIPAP
ncbi:hypothetical protein OIU84_010901 [Salix udensis]|uniref:Uncharacterized protein n=1 Tax=Salix udensis TaxID=889485 RepID=A0AAD6NW39_9ROSI|nr:hypothetical protein OIU84_010901 [Salix udensis]